MRIVFRDHAARLAFTGQAEEMWEGLTDANRLDQASAISGLVVTIERHCLGDTLACTVPPPYCAAAEDVLQACLERSATKRATTDARRWVFPGDVKLEE